MAIIRGSVDTYTLSLSTPNYPVPYKRVIYIKGDFGLAFLYFVPPDGSLGDNKQRSGSEVFDIWYHDEAWAPTVDVLRNEKPIYFFFDDNYKYATLKTSNEPVGEEEAT